MLLPEVPEARSLVQGFFGTDGVASSMRSLFGVDGTASAPSSAPLVTFFDELFRTTLRTSSASGFFIPAMSKTMGYRPSTDKSNDEDKNDQRQLISTSATQAVHRTQAGDNELPLRQ